MIVVILYSGKSFIFKKRYLGVLATFFVSTVVTWLLYLKAALKDPGYVKSNSIKVDSEPS
jgi:hypothetical protein